METGRARVSIRHNSCMSQTGLMGRLEHRWARRQEAMIDGREPFTAQAAVMILTSPQTVWDFLGAPGAGVLLDHRFVKSFPVPGTPAEGVDHQYCNLLHDDDGTLQVILSEIVEFEPPRHVVRKIVNTPIPILESHTIDEVPGGCSYAVRLGLRIPVGTRGQVAVEVQRDLNESAAKLKALIEAGVRPGGSPEDRGE